MRTSADKKPLAEVLGEEDHAPAAIRIGGRVFEPAEITSLFEARDFVEAINAAVESREAQLKVAFRDLRQVLVDAMIAIEHPDMRPSPWSILEAGRLASLPHEIDARGAVSGDVACGLAFDLGVMQGHFHGSWQVMLSMLLDKGGEASEMAWLLIDALGLRRSPREAPHDRSPSTMQLIDELLRRGANAEQRTEYLSDSLRRETTITLRIRIDDREFLSAETPHRRGRAFDIPAGTTMRQLYEASTWPETANLPADPAAEHQKGDSDRDEK